MAVINGTAGNDTLKGGTGSDTIYGYAGDDRIDGGSGGDVMYGGAGNDTYIVDNSYDQVIEYENQGIDRVRTTVNGYRLPDNVEILEMVDHYQMLSGYGNNLDNVVYGNSYNNYIETGDYGNDLIYGGAGNDTISAGYGDDTIYGGLGDDSILGSNGNDYIEGNEGNDYISAGSGSDTIKGGAGNDTLSIGGGANAFVEMDGGTGDDTMYISGSGHFDVIDESGFDTLKIWQNKANIALFMEDGDLVIDAGAAAGTTVVNIKDQSSGAIDVLYCSDNSYLTSSTINQLIQDMSAYATQQGITISSVEDVKANADLMHLINSSWTAAA